MNKPAQKLTLEEVKAAGRAAYDRNGLTAQAEDWTHRECFYEVQAGCNCVIGASLTPETMEEIFEQCLNHGTPLSQLMEHGIVAVDDADEALALEELQELHDAWCEFAQIKGHGNADEVQARQLFLAAIDHPEAKLGAIL